MSGEYSVVLRGGLGPDGARVVTLDVRAGDGRRIVCAGQRGDTVDVFLYELSRGPPRTADVEPREFRRGDIIMRRGGERGRMATEMRHSGRWRGHAGNARHGTAVAALVLALSLTLTPAELRAQEAEAPGGPTDGEKVPTATCPDTVTQAAGVWIVGRVTDASSGVVLPGGTVELTWKEGGRVQEISTSVRGDGVYHFCNAPAGMHLTLRAVVAGRSGGMKAVDVPSGELAIREDLSIVLSDDAQGRVVGQIVDKGSGRGIEAATVRLEPGGMEAVTSHDGRFAVSGVPVGEYELQMRHVAYGSHTATVSVREDRTADVSMRVPERAVEMEPLEVEVTVRQRYRSLERRGFYERMNTAQAHGGRFLPPELIERRQAGKLSHLLQTVPGVETYRTCGGTACPVIPAIRGCRTPGTTGTKGVPAIFVDGVRFRLDIGGSLGKGIDELSANNVRAMEIYRSGAQMPAQFQDLENHCAIVIWTKSGPDRNR